MSFRCLNQRKVRYGSTLPTPRSAQFAKSVSHRWDHESAGATTLCKR